MLLRKLGLPRPKEACAAPFATVFGLKAHLRSPLLGLSSPSAEEILGPHTNSGVPPLILSSPSTSSVAIAVVKLRVPGIVARQMYTPECCTFTSEIMRFPFPSTRVLKTSMDLWSVLRET